VADLLTMAVVYHVDEFVGPVFAMLDPVVIVVIIVLVVVVVIVVLV
jgi:hypothetical protein